MPKHQRGFAVIEPLLLLVVVGLIGFIGWYAWNANHPSTPDTASQSPPPSAQPTPPLSAYRRTTTVPTSWKTYADSEHKFSIAYPGDWRVGESDGAVEDLSSLPIELELSFTPPPNPGSQHSLSVVKENLDKAVSDFEKEVEQVRNNSPGNNYRIVNKKYFTYDGNSAVQIDTSASSVAGPNGTPPASDSAGTQFYVAAHGLVYKIDLSSSTIALPFENATLLTLVESLRIS